MVSRMLLPCCVIQVTDFVSDHEASTCHLVTYLVYRKSLVQANIMHTDDIHRPNCLAASPCVDASDRQRYCRTENIHTSNRFLIGFSYLAVCLSFFFSFLYFVVRVRRRRKNVLLMSFLYFEMLLEAE